ncbi:MAG: hypothetical protein IJH34_15075, partial [Romboutsia sp.]|nr:hypothetical protein [Romboutsia sp.]
EYKLQHFVNCLNERVVKYSAAIFGTIASASDGMTPEYSKLYGDFTTGMLFESGCTVAGSGIKSASALIKGESISKESIIAGSGIGNLGRKGKAILRSGKQVELPGRNGALNQAKKDANILRTQHPDDVVKVKMTEAESRGGHVIKDENGNMVECREYYYTNREGEKVIIQEHVYPHVGSPGPHFNVRPSTDPRNGVFEGTKEHYQFKK